MNEKREKRYRDCVTELETVLRRYDMAGVVTVIDRDRAMFLYVFPSWSCIRVEKAGVRFRAKRQDYPSDEAQHEAIELSTHIILQARDIAALTVKQMETIAKELEKNLEIEHKSFQDFDPEIDS